MDIAGKMQSNRAHGGGIVFVEIRIDRNTAIVPQQRFVIFESCGHGFPTERDDEDALKLYLILELFKEMHQHIVHDQEAVLGMVDDVRQFVSMEPKVQGVQHAPCARNSEVGFQVNAMVPHQASDSVSALEARRLQNCGKRSCTPGHFSVGIAVN